MAKAWSELVNQERDVNVERRGSRLSGAVVQARSVPVTPASDSGRAEVEGCCATDAVVIGSAS